ncbi:hypothetical protein QTN25_005494 [Entamoeba marina]
MVTLMENIKLHKKLNLIQQEYYVIFLCTDTFIYKEWSADFSVASYIERSKMKKILNCKVNIGGREQILSMALGDPDFIAAIFVQGKDFNSDNDFVFSLFRRWKYNSISILGDYKNYIENFKYHLHKKICNYNDEINDYVLNWMANILQNLGKRNNTAIMLKGNPGTGKTYLTDIIFKLTASYSCSCVSDLVTLTGRFNGLLEKLKVFICVNEFDRNNELDPTGLKTYITDKKVQVQPKGKEVFTAKNVSNYVNM